MRPFAILVGLLLGAAAIALIAVGRRPDGDAPAPERLGEVGAAVRVIEWSGRRFAVKSSLDAPTGPGENYFSDGVDAVRVDRSGSLHLRLTERDGRWHAAEVISLDRFGYGSYRFWLASAVADLPPSVVLGLFTWDPDAPDAAFREIDLEASRWLEPETPLTFQYVTQPYELPGHRHRFALDDDGPMLHCFEWLPGRVRFESRDAAGRVVQAWTIAGATVPPEGPVEARLNLWLIDALPPDRAVEVVIDRFAFVPEPRPGSRAADATPCGP